MDEDAARAWVARAAERTASLQPVPPEGQGLPAIPADYGCDGDDEDTKCTTVSLLAAAWRFGVIRDARHPAPADPFSPEGVARSALLEWWYEPWDGMSTGYRWALDVPRAPFSAAGEFSDMEELGSTPDGPEGTEGAELAFEVLREAVYMGNLLAGALAAYAASDPN